MTNEIFKFWNYEVSLYLPHNEKPKEEEQTHNPTS